MLPFSVLSCLSCPTLCDSKDYSQPGSSVQDSSGKSVGVGCHDLHQGIFLTQRSNSGSPHCREILYFLSHQGSPVLQIPSNKLLEWLSHFTFLPKIYDRTSITKFLPAFIIFFLTSNRHIMIFHCGFNL